MCKQISWIVGVGFFAMVVACGPPSTNNTVTDPLVLDQAETEGSLVQNVQDVMSQLSVSVAFLADNEFASDTVGAALANDCDDEELGDDEDCGEPSTSLSASISQGRDELIEFLQTRVLTDAQLESAPSALTLVYRLDPATHCGDSEECTSLLTEHPIRLAIQSGDKETFVVAIQVGEESLNPMTFVVGPEELAVVVDFASLAAVASTLNVTNENGESKIPVPQVAEGLVRVAIQDLGGTRAQISLDVLEAVALEFAQNGEVLGMNVGAAELALNADNATQVIGAKAFASAIAASVPGQFVSGSVFGISCSAPAMMGADTEDDDCEDAAPPQLTETFQLLVAGLSGSATLDFTQELLSFTNLGLGTTTSTLTYGEATLVSLDINPNDGRAFDVRLEKGEAGGPVFRFSSIVDLGVTFDLTPIQTVLSDTPAWALQDGLRAVLDGAKEPALALLDKAVQVVSGTLAMSSTHEGVEALEVPEGSCLVPADDADEFAPVSFIQTLAQGQCPANEPDWD